jgi:predicted dehydrogenase
VFVETPACTTSEECREIRVELSKHPELKSATGHVARHWPTYKAAKSIVDSGKLGKIFYAESDYAHDIDPEIYPPRPHKWEPHVMGRLSISYHSVDLLRYIVGDVEEVSGYISEEASLAMLRFKNGALGKVFSSGKVTRPYILSLEVYGSEGTLICAQEENELRGYWHKSRYWKPEKLPTSVNHGKGTPEWKMEMEDIVDSILENRRPLCTLEDGVATVETCIAIDTAMTIGTRVKVRP